uniref:Chemosensory protein 11 n=1 Tax=Heortia vitessoides TaxID=1557813 RepID=A0A978W7B7_9NEOP|nr:chemosensory protein 11 [Heortia vitessoides]
MYPQLAIVSGLLCLISSETTAPGIDRRFSDGVKSNGYRMIYGNEDISIINNVVDEMEKYNPLKENRRTMMETLHPLAPEDVKCMMSVDRYCSHSMLKTKEVLIQALKNDCEKCTNDEKDNAGLVAAAMMAYEPVAWKLFLTRYDGLSRVQRILG